MYPRFNRPTRGCSVNVMKSDIIRVAIAPAKGKVAGEALVDTQRFCWGFNHVVTITACYSRPTPPALRPNADITLKGDPWD